MTDAEALAAKDALIALLLEQNAVLVARVAELEAKLGLGPQPPKTPDNSSLPPSSGQKSSGSSKTISATNNGSERALRPCAIYRKITNGFRSEWAATLYADIRSAVETGRRRATRAIRLSLAGRAIPSGEGNQIELVNVQILLN